MKSWQLPALACAAIVLAISCWHNVRAARMADETALIARARAANAELRLADVGLRGTVGLSYGPLPTQAYQMLLAIAGDDVGIVARLHSFLCAGATAAALLWLTASLGWSPWLAALPLCSPFFVHYTRLLWDNPFAMPLGATLVAAWAAHLRTGGRGAFLTAAAAAIALPTVHPMTLPLAGVFAAHALICHVDSFRRHAKSLACVLAILGLLNAGYARQFKWDGFDPHAARAFPTSADFEPMTLAFPWLGGELLSGYRFHRLDDPDGPKLTLEQTRAGAIARDVSVIAFPLVWLGVGSIVARAIAARRGRGDDPRSSSIDVGDVIGSLCVLALAAETVMRVASHVYAYAHYHIGTWPAAVVCLWAGLREPSHRAFAPAVGIALALALAAVTICSVVEPR